jgi:hypothetical protein
VPSSAATGPPMTPSASPTGWSRRRFGCEAIELPLRPPHEHSAHARLGAHLAAQSGPLAETEIAIDPKRRCSPRGGSASRRKGPRRAAVGPPTPARRRRRAPAPREGRARRRRPGRPGCRPRGGDRTPRARR